MKRLFTILLSACICCMASAQPDKWFNKSAKAVFTLKTFDASGTLIGSSNGYFVTAAEHLCNLVDAFIVV